MKSFENYRTLENKLKDAEQHALDSPDREVCGFIYGHQYIPLTNIAKDSRSFIADPSEVALALKRYGEPLAIFHSHPNGSVDPSPEDLKLASYYSNSMIIIGALIGRRVRLQHVTNA